MNIYINITPTELYFFEYMILNEVLTFTNLLIKLLTIGDEK